MNYSIFGLGFILDPDAKLRFSITFIIKQPFLSFFQWYLKRIYFKDYQQTINMNWTELQDDKCQ